MKARHLKPSLPAVAFFAPVLVVAAHAQNQFPRFEDEVHAAQVYGPVSLSRIEAVGQVLARRMEAAREQQAADFREILRAEAARRAREEERARARMQADLDAARVRTSETSRASQPTPSNPIPCGPNRGGTITRGNTVIVVPPSPMGTESRGVVVKR
jgi:hypothetical protein